VIKISRTTEPPRLAADKAAWTQELCEARRDWHAEITARRKRGDASAPPKKPRAEKRRYARDDVKDALRAMFGSRCAYCEGEVDATSHLHVEHFRPQSRYPALAYEWDNLLLACGRCNSDHKRDSFRLLPHGRTPGEDVRSPCSRDDTDAATLIDPCREDPVPHFSFHNGRIIARTARGRRTRDACGLNREDLVDDRREVLRLFRDVIRGYQEAGRTGKRAYGQTLYACTEPDYRYFAMLNAELHTRGIDRAQLPR